MSEERQADVSPEFEDSKEEAKKGGGRRRLLLIVGGVLMLLCVCVAGLAALSGGDGEETAAEATALVEEGEAVAEEPEDEAPTEAPEPTETPAPTETPEPTNTPEPTATPAPTDTPAPTATATPPPEPIVLTGTGDSIVDVEKGSRPALVRIQGNAASSHFAVTSYGEGNEVLDLLVNTTEPYEGLRPLDFFEGEETVRFEVNAQGEWTIEILPLQSAETVIAPGEKSGSGDYVFAVEGTPDTAHITGNAGSRHMAVTAFSGSGVDLLVNTTEPYDGQVLLSPDTFLIEVTAAGDWTIVFE